MSAAETTTDHAVIKGWIEERKGRPSVVRATEDSDDGGKAVDGLLRVDFGEPDDALADIDWDAFFRIFDENNLAFLHQDKTADGHVSRFSKFVAREDGDDASR
jgi:hypothetical protein